MTEAGPTVPSARPSAWAPLRHRVFLGLFIAQIASNVGSMMQNVGAAWLMGDLSASPTLVALVQTATLLPVFLIGLPAGALADIFDRRRLLIVTPDLDAGDRRRCWPRCPSRTWSRPCRCCS